MPTDGADFGRTKSCYGKVYTALRSGADDAYVAELAVRGIERDIRRDNGTPAFRPLSQLLTIVTAAGGGGAAQLFRGADAIAREYGASALCRNLVAATLKAGLAAINGGKALSLQGGAEAMLLNVVSIRCDGMAAYVTRHRTQSVAETEMILASVVQKASVTGSLGDLASRMLNSSAKGLPAKIVRGPRLDHSADSLNNTSLDSDL